VVLFRRKKLIYWGKEKNRERMKFRCPLIREKTTVLSRVATGRENTESLSISVPIIASWRIWSFLEPRKGSKKFTKSNRH